MVSAIILTLQIFTIQFKFYVKNWDILKRKVLWEYIVAM